MYPLNAAAAVEGLNKTFKVPGGKACLGGSVRSLFRRNFWHLKTVKQISFRLEPGKIVGFLGASA